MPPRVRPEKGVSLETLSVKDGENPDSASMTRVRFPVHKLCYVKKNGRQILLAAAGETIQTFALHDGSRLGSWPHDAGEQVPEARAEPEERPSKRLKTEDSSHAALVRQESEISETSIEIVSEGKERQKGERRRPKVPDLSLPNVSHILATSDSQHAVAVTAEDKAVRVFTILENGKLKQLTRRVLPKRLCAVRLSSDQKTILAADKFGDVYGLPLHVSPDWKPPAPSLVVEKDDKFKPSASESTVHTKGNLEALRQQLKLKQTKPKKEGLEFELKLLLGHVSLLTDLLVVKHECGEQYILTCDRDEHIRVTRDIPQTHIIHGFCLGHTEFVSRLTVPSWFPNTLIAGNGEASLRVYDWRAGEELYRCGVLDVVSWQQAITDILDGVPDRDVSRIAVSGLWPIQHSRFGNTIMMAMEGLPLLFEFTIGQDLRPQSIIRTAGNVLDLVYISELDILAVCVDVTHECGSYRNYRAENMHDASSVQFWKRTKDLNSNSVSWDEQQLSLEIEPIVKDVLAHKQENQEAGDAKYERNYSQLGEFLYGLENLRKRRDRAAEEEEEEEDLVETPPVS